MSDPAVILIVLAVCRGKLSPLRAFISDRLGSWPDGFRGNGTRFPGSSSSAPYLTWPEIFKMCNPRDSAFYGHLVQVRDQEL